MVEAWGREDLKTKDKRKVSRIRCGISRVMMDRVRMFLEREK